MYHFWKCYIVMSLAGVGIYLYHFYKDFRMVYNYNLEGLFPYALHIYLKNCLAAPRETLNYWCMPCPVSQWVMGLLVGVASVWASPEFYASIAVFSYFLLDSMLVLCNHVTGCMFFYREGPWFRCMFRAIERICPQFILAC